jgi:hypothetical protein
MQACGADSARIESVPVVSAGAKPFVFLAGRLAAQRAAGCAVRRDFVLTSQRPSVARRAKLTDPIGD